MNVKRADYPHTHKLRVCLSGEHVRGKCVYHSLGVERDYLIFFLVVFFSRMFSLAQGFYKELTYVPERRIVMLGVDSAGKSSILEWIRLMPSTMNTTWPPSNTPPPNLEKMMPTVGLNVFNLRLRNETLLIWDLGGAKKLRPIWDPYVAQAEAVIWVVDASDATRLHESAQCLRTIMEKPHLTNSPLLVFANKQDVHGTLDAVKTSLALDLLSDAEKRAQCVQPTSAITGRGIRDGIEWIAERLRNPTGEVKTSIK